MAIAPSMRARLAATRRASYRGSDSCLYDPSCSSSITITPRSGTAANTAERAPTTTRASPAAIRACSAPLRAGVSALCSTATVSPNRATNRPAVCGVSAISGTSTTAPLPCSSARSITAR